MNKASFLAEHRELTRRHFLQVGAGGLAASLLWNHADAEEPPAAGEAPTNAEPAHEVALGDVGKLGRQRQPAHGFVARRLLELPLLDLAGEEVADPVAGLLAQLERDLAADRVDAGLDAELRDPGAHGTEPDHPDRAHLHGARSYRGAG